MNGVPGVMPFESKTSLLGAGGGSLTPSASSSPLSFASARARSSASCAALHGTESRV